ncbi:DUF6335 family protein [Myxosarcina sp. GI1]|uniref:DUF6335 family protein n=1 Tax=Myxosarcina sp. GI1 TaxID=1541065 RepID=UPI00056A8F0A|nr:DUF6335 family protein [Myxosarcina sp. GI1]
MESGQEKFANTEPFAEGHDADKLGKKAGIKMSEAEELGLKDKLEERDDSRLELNPKRSPSEPTTDGSEL